MTRNRAAQPFFLLFLGLILVMTAVPPLLGWLGVAFTSPIQGGAGSATAAWTFGRTQVGLELGALGFAGLIVLLTVLYDKATSSRFSRLLGFTVGLFGLVDGIRLVSGSLLPEGSVTFFDGTLAAAVVSRLGGALVLAVGCGVLRWGHHTSRRIGLLQVVVPGGLVVAAAWWAMSAFTSAPHLPLPAMNLATLVLYGAAAACLRAEMRHYRLRFFGRGVLAAFIPLVVGQLLLAFVVRTAVDDALHIADLLRAFAWLIAAAGLGIDYVNSFYAKGVSLEMRYLRTVIDAIPHFIYARDTQGRFVLVNQAVADFHGLKVHEIEGRHVMDVHRNVQQCQEWLAEDRATMDRGHKVFLPGTIATHGSGRDIWLDTVKTPLKSRLGINDQILGVSIDVSEKRQAERDLAAARDAAEESNRAKSEFLANMSHEIRTPMNCIIGLADLLKDMDGDPRHRQYLDMIRMSGASLLTLINDILDISKIEAGQLELDLVDTDLQALVEETAGLIAFNAQSKGLEMVCRLAPGVPTRLMLDPGRLRQVLINLLNNAAKFTQQGHIYLNIEPVGEHDGLLDICFRVTDTGIGIEPDNLGRIFEKFTQAEAGTTRRFGGTGLGLSISQHLVKLMGGRISATSEVGVGTTFTFTVPLAATAPGLRPDRPEPAVAQRVLVLTDHELGGEVLAEQVRSLGHVCRIAVGVEGLHEAIIPAAGQEPWTIILADETHFEGDEPALRSRLAGLPAGRRPRVIMLNKLNNLYRDEELAELGCQGALSKPVRLSQLAAVLAGEAVARRPVARVTAQRVDPARLEADPTHGPRVLLAEDNPFNQKVAVAMLRLLGCRVEVAGTGVQALDMARQGGFDLVLMDCQMPIMDGYVATRRIRKLPAPAGDVKIIAMTANALSGDRRACFAAGMNDFLSKPITRTMLQDMLVKWEVLAGEPAPEPAPEPVGEPV